MILAFMFLWILHILQPIEPAWATHLLELAMWQQLGLTFLLGLGINGLSFGSVVSYVEKRQEKN